MKKIAILVFLLVGFSSAAMAEEILKTQTSWDGGKFGYPQGDPEVTAIILRLDKAKTAKFHCHPVPTFGYVLKGTLDVETKLGKTIRLTKGDAAVEVMRTIHRGVVVEGPVEILVFYAGAKNLPNTVLPDSPEAEKHCD